MKYYKLEIKQGSIKEITREEAIRLVGLVYNNPKGTLDRLSVNGVSYLKTPLALIYKQE